MADQKFDLNEAFRDQLSANREDYKRLRGYAQLLRSKINEQLKRLVSQPDHAEVQDVVIRIAAMANEVRTFLTQITLSSRFGKDPDFIKAVDNMQRLVETTRKDVQTVANLYMNEYKHGV
jgi:DNA gyrase/topoisomerase IV subunit A